VADVGVFELLPGIAERNIYMLTDSNCFSWVRGGIFNSVACLVSCCTFGA
jgi:hypothetical protein